MAARVGQGEEGCGRVLLVVMNGLKKFSVLGPLLACTTRWLYSVPPVRNVVVGPTGGKNLPVLVESSRMLSKSNPQGCEAGRLATLQPCSTDGRGDGQQEVGRFALCQNPSRGRAAVSTPALRSEMGKESVGKILNVPTSFDQAACHTSASK